MAPHTFFLARSPEAPNTAGMLVHRFHPSYVPRIVVSFESTCWRSLDMYGGVDWCDPNFFLWRPYSKVPHRVPTGPCVRRFCGRAYETANRLISIRPRCYFCTCRPYVHMWGRSTYQTQPGLRVRAGVPRGAQRTVLRPLSSRFACLGIKLKFQANLWTGKMGGS